MRTTATARWTTRRTAAAWACCSSRSRSTSAIRPSWRRAKLGRCACTCPPKGRVLDQALACELAQQEHVLFLCGHYEGRGPAGAGPDCGHGAVDRRLCAHRRRTAGGGGGRLYRPLVPGVLAEEECFTEESHYGGLLGIRTTRARRFFRASPCRKFCWAETTAKSSAGGAGARWRSPGAAVRICC